MPELNFALQPSFQAFSQSAPASDAGIFKGAELAQRNKDRALQSKQVDAQLARDALSAQLQPLRMREAELKVQDAAADMAWQSTRRELEAEAARTFNQEVPKILDMQKSLDPFGAYKATFDLGIRYPILGTYKPYQDLMEQAKASATLQLNRDRLTELDDYHEGMIQAREDNWLLRDTRTADEKNADAYTSALDESQQGIGFDPMSASEMASEKVDWMARRATGSGRGQKEPTTAAKTNFAMLKTLTDPGEIEIFLEMAVGKSGKAKNEAQLMRKFVAQEQIRNLRALNLSDAEFNAAADKIMAEYEASLGETKKPDGKSKDPLGLFK